MLASRLFSFRVDRVWKLTSTSLIGNSVYADLRYNLRVMAGKNNVRYSNEGRKKLKGVTLAWRPVCSQASAFEECSMKGVNVVQEDGNRVDLSHCSTSVSVASIEDVDMEYQEVRELMKSTTISRVIPDEDADIIHKNMRECMTTLEKHSVSFQVGASLMRFIKGKGGSMQKKIEEEHEIKIVFPSSREEDFVIIEGNSVECVNGAIKRMQTFIDELVQSPNLQYSHFISFPLAIYPELVEKLVHFQNSILGVSDCMPDEIEECSSDEEIGNQDRQLRQEENICVELKAQNCNEHVEVKITDITPTRYVPKTSKSSALSDLGIDRSIFNKPKTFHLTVLMLKLWNKERVKDAAEVLRNVSDKVNEALDGRPISIRLKGLECMRGSLKNARVLYAPVEEIGGENRLMRACQTIMDAYHKAGLILEKDAKQGLKLHATMMNASHRKSKGRKRFDSFDARGIVEQFGSEEWGDYLIREAHLSQRFVYGENGYYHCCATLPFPENVPLVQSPNLQYSHFISFPLAIYPELVEKLVHFQNSILGVSDCMPDEIEECSSDEEIGNQDRQLRQEENICVELKAQNCNEHVEVKITDITPTRYVPKTSKSSALSDLGIDRSIFNKPKTFHLTVLMLKLWNKERVKDAAEVLRNVSDKVNEALDGRPISIRLKGLECMRGSLKNARVLYAPVEEIGGENRLMRACQTIMDAYHKAGLILEKDAKQGLKLHATMMNASHRKSKGRKRFDSFDARGIVEQFGSEEWGDYLIREAHLSQRFVYGENGYYHCCATLPFPENVR